MFLTSIENAFKTAAHDLVTGFKAVEAVAAKLAASPIVTEAEQAANAVLTGLDPAAAKAVEVGEAVASEGLRGSGGRGLGRGGEGNQHSPGPNRGCRHSSRYCRSEI